MLEASLTAPTLLVAMPQIQDPFFHQSVVLLVSHDEDGSLGFVINRGTNLTVASILEELEVVWQGDEESRALLGGPVRPQLGTVLLASSALASDSFEVAPGISITQDLETLRALAEAPPAGFRLVLGYAGWSPGQLDEEVERHDWPVCPVDCEIVFDPCSEAVWSRSLEALGLQASDLPEWTQASTSVN